MELIRARAAGLVRRGLRATVLLAVLAGLAAGIATAMVAAGRRTATAYDRFYEHADVPELLLNFCPPGFVLGPEADVTRCYLYDAAEEEAVLEALPEVESATRGAFRGLTVAAADRPDERVAASAIVGEGDETPPNLAGDHLLVEGREAKGPDEVLLNEFLAEHSGLGVGDDAVLTFWSKEEIGDFVEEDPPPFEGPSIEVEVVGIGRGLTDLAQAQVGFGLGGEAAVLYAGPGLGAATADAGAFRGMLVDATADDREAATAAIEAAFPGQPFQVADALGIEEIAPTRDAIGYEAQAMTTLGLVVALLAIAFVGQAIARQSRREWSDGPVLRAMGFTSGEASAAAALRSLSIGIPGAALAVGVAALLSPQGPVGVGRRAEIDPGFHLDGLVLAIGAVVVIVVSALAAVAPMVRGRALRTLAPVPPRRRPHRFVPLPPVATAGLHLARTGRGRGVEVTTALTSAAAAVIVTVAAGSLVASFDDLQRSPERFGAPWDVSVGVPFEDEASVREILRGHRAEIDRAAAIRGQDLLVEDESAWTQAFVPMDGVADEAPPLPIDEGRPPATPREIAVGALTLQDIDRSVGDRVTLTNVASNASVEVTIVGTAVINDTFESSPGRGALVTPELIAEMAPEVEDGDPAVVSLRRGVDVDAFMEDLREEIDTPIQRPLQQAALRNVDRIRELPYVMATVVGLLALASLVHALVLSVSRNRRVLGVLKGLGFTKGQVAGTIAWHATSYAVAATVIALPLGVMAGRWGWRAVSDSLGVPDVAVLPLAALALVAVALVLLANLAAAYPGWRAARLSTASALRAE